MFRIYNITPKMILSVDGLLSIGAAYVNIITISDLLSLTTEKTQLYAKIPFVKLLFVYTFAYSVIKNKIACAIATLVFFMLESGNFVEDAETAT